MKRRVVRRPLFFTTGVRENTQHILRCHPQLIKSVLYVSKGRRIHIYTHMELVHWKIWEHPPFTGEEDVEDESTKTKGRLVPVCSLDDTFSRALTILSTCFVVIIPT